jgi:hypothetical protein
MAFHRQLFKCLILDYHHTNYELNATLTEDDIMDIISDQIHEYCGSNENDAGLAAAGSYLATAGTLALGASGIVNKVGTQNLQELVAE